MAGAHKELFGGRGRMEMGGAGFEGTASAIMLMRLSGSGERAGDGGRGCAVLNGCNIS